MRPLPAASLLISMLVMTPLLSAQTNAHRTAEQIKAAFNAHQGEFDYLLGDWEFTAENPQYGKFHGKWSGVRLAEGQILDEYRVVGDGGEGSFIDGPQAGNHRNGISCERSEHDVRQCSLRLLAHGSSRHL